MQFPYMEVRHFSLPYTGLAWLYMEVRHQNIFQQGGNDSCIVFYAGIPLKRLVFTEGIFDLQTYRGIISQNNFVMDW